MNNQEQIRKLYEYSQHLQTVFREHQWSRRQTGYDSALIARMESNFIILNNKIYELTQSLIPEAPLKQIMGQWPGDETTEQLLEALKQPQPELKLLRSNPHTKYDFHEGSPLWMSQARKVYEAYEAGKKAQLDADRGVE